MTCRKLGKTHQTYEQTLYLEMASSLWNACCQPSSCQTSLAFLKMLVTTHPSKNVVLLSMWPDNDTLCMKKISLSKLAHSTVHTSRGGNIRPVLSRGICPQIQICCFPISHNIKFQKTNFPKKITLEIHLYAHVFGQTLEINFLNYFPKFDTNFFEEIENFLSYFWITLKIYFQCWAKNVCIQINF